MTQPAHILIADDAPDQRIVLRAALERAGYSVDIASNGVEALEKARKTVPDLVIADVLMPEMDGFALCRELKDDPSLAGIPVVFHTASYLDERDLDLGRSLGAAHYLLKPVDFKKMLGVVAEVLAREPVAHEERSASDDDFERLHAQTLARQLDRKVRELEEERKALRASEHLLRDVTEAASDWIWETDEQHRFTNLSDRFYELTGVDPARVLGRTRWGMGGPATDPEALLTNRNQMEQHEPFRDFVYQTGLDTSGGRLRHFKVSGKPIFDEFDAFLGYRGIGADITQQVEAEQELEESRRTLHNLMENLPGMAFRSRNDRKWTMEFVSSGVIGLTGHRPEDLIGNNKVCFADLIHPDDRDEVWHEVQSSAWSGRSFQLTYRLLTAPGEERWVLMQGSGVMAADGTVAAVEGVMLDVTERKQTEQALSALAESTSEPGDEDFIRHCLQALAETYRARYAFIGVFYGKDRTRLHTAAFWSDGQFLGDRIYTLAGTPGEEILARRTQLVSRNARRRFSQDALLQEFEVESVFGMPLTASDGKDLGLVAVMDTRPMRPSVWARPALGIFANRLSLELERQRADEQIRRSRELLRLTLENAPIGIGAADVRGRVVSVNPEFCSIIGYGAEELLRMSVQDLVHPDDLAATVASNRALITGKVPSYEREVRFQRKGGQTIDAYVRVGLVHDAEGEPLMTVGQVEDITERKRTERALRESEERLRAFYDNTPSEIYLKDAEGRYVLVNRHFERTHALSKEQLLGKKPDDIYDEALAKRVMAHDRTVLETGKVMSAEYEVPLVDGIHTLITIKFPIPGASGGVAGIGAISTDITERKEAENEAQRVRQFLKDIIDSMPSVLVGVDQDGAVTRWNLGAAQLTGIESEEAIGRLVVDLLPQLSERWEAVLEAIATKSPFKEERLQWMVDGTSRFAELMVYPLTGAGTAGGVIRLDDVTSRVRMEEMMVQTEKMLSVGGLAAGMAHEINNPLGAILQSCQNVLRRISPELERNRQVADDLGLDLEAMQTYFEQREVLGFLHGIQDAGKRAARIVSDMLTFSRKSEAELVPANLHDLLDTALRLAGSDYDLKKRYDLKQIDIRREYSPEVGEVKCDPTEIEQVILNLVRNAAQAMTESGSGRFITLRTGRDGDHVRIDVIDNGPGMDEKTRKRVFEPFFTTKEVGVGTGLGLAVSYFIVTEQHKGTMSVHSAPGLGTRFTLRLPL